MSIQQKIVNKINDSGFIYVDEFMSMVIEHYYQNNTIFGEDGDFTTAPEISQLFGEVLAVWILSKVESLTLDTFVLAELGPGRGTLMRDILNVITNLPAFQHKLKGVYMLEQSTTLKHMQQQALSKYTVEKFWISTIKELPKVPIIFVANEFFDALPIKQFIGGVERRIILLEGKLQFDDGQGEITETSVSSISFFSEICSHISQHGGGAVVVDYGYYQGEQGDTLQAVKNHKYASLFEQVGTADITAHVNFKMLIEICEEYGLPCEINTQGAFLKNWGILSLASKYNADDAEVNRLIAKEEMGELFKVLMVS